MNHYCNRINVEINLTLNKSPQKHHQNWIYSNADANLVDHKKRFIVDFNLSSSRLFNYLCINLILPSLQLQRHFAIE